MSKTIAVIGATGNVGRELAGLLLASGVRVRAIGRSALRLQPLAARGADRRVGLAEDPKFLAEAFRGADGVFAMLPPDYAHPDPAARAEALGTAIGAALQVARITHAVTLSSIGADRSDRNGPIAGLNQLERRVNAVPGINAYHLRAGYFFENWLSNIELIRSAGINGGALSPDLPMPMIASRDVAAVAARALVNPSFVGQRSRELQGPRDYTPRQATAILGAAIGRPDLMYIQFPYPDFSAALTRTGFSPAMAEQFAEMARGFNERVIRGLEPRSADTTTATTLEEFATTVFAPAFSH